ncbi:MAG: phosphohistidine phosphatase SixA [Gemmataceae bacterium]|nr:phosphohistidine phosphatase SixA [Gemmataceae bacterium]
MDLYLIRHAEAVSRDDAQYKDEERPLTEKGREQARALARSLVARKVHFDAVISSPLVRARQTAEELLQNMPGPLGELEFCHHLSPGGKPRKLTRFLLGTGGESVAVIGHEPDLSTFIGRLIGSRDAQILLAKGGLAKVECEGVPDKDRGMLAWLLTPTWTMPVEE